MPHLTPAWFIPFFQGVFLGILAMAVHEAGHLIAALILRVRIKSVGLRWKGVYTVREPGPPVSNILVSLAGPMVNLVLIASYPWSPTFSVANLCFTVFNLLPLDGSDGTHAWNCWRKMRQMRSAAK